VGRNLRQPGGWNRNGTLVVIRLPVSDLRRSPMTATVHAFPANRIVRRPMSPTTARMTEADLCTLRRRWPLGWHEPATTHDGITFDQWLVPFDCAIDLPPASTIALQPSGTWTRHDAFGRLVKTGQSVAEVVAYPWRE
jgi:hypothetical protein